jgi:hypothetical protein
MSDEQITLSRHEWRLLWTLLDVWLRTDRQVEFSEAATEELTALGERIARYIEPDRLGGSG